MALVALPAKVLLCPPTHFGVEYVINPWMRGNVGAASATVARRQWDALAALLDDLCDVTTIEPQPGLPDMCFAANAGFAFDGTFVTANFSVFQRAPEISHYREWVEAAGLAVVEPDDAIAFEGEGDALWWPRGDESILCAGYGVRSSLESHRLLAERLGVRVLSLRLTDARFYHLDTCLVPLPQGRLIYYPPAFDERSRHLLESLASAEDRCEVSAEDAAGFACNAVRIGQTLIVSHASTALKRQLEKWGFDVAVTPLTEFIKAGGAAKCLTLLLDQEATERTETASAIRTQALTLEGHLLSRGILNRAFDTVEVAGGAIRIERFRGGERRDQASHARLQVSAPDEPMLADTLSQLRRLAAFESGTRISLDDEGDDATLAVVERDGVAPEDFCCSTIYPTDVHVHGKWLRVKRQRMDATIVVDDSEPPQARCVLPRDLKTGDKVVRLETGVRVHVVHHRSDGDDFAFMSSVVTSERRVEGQVAELALEMRRVHARGGSIVVVAGPVVIHTGGGEHLAELIRTGYVQALLTGNALPVHDMEANLYGTSLGVDLRRGAGVRGGHRHHLRTINRIRAAGSIAEAVRQGVVTGGVMAECVQAGVPYVLAGSIRDDGPLPDTQMDMIAAQAAYQRQIEGADLVLMLATMLHAIGVGNMTPAGVRLVCVDINPAVVTKLADRGSVESTGIVTDVGLFLGLLASRLRA